MGTLSWLRERGAALLITAGCAALITAVCLLAFLLDQGFM